MHKLSKNNKYLHLIAYDNGKFLYGIQKLFEDAQPGEHIYVVLKSPSNLKWEKKVSPIPYTVIEQPNQLKDIISNISNLRGIVLNGVLRQVIPYQHLFPKDVPIAWYFWGYEIYSIWPCFVDGLYGPETKKFFKPRWKQQLRPYYWAVKGFYRPIKKLLSRIDYFVSQFREEYDLFKEIGALRKTEFIEGAVISLENLTNLNDEAYWTGENILIGNSANPTNNFADIFKSLARFKLKDRRLIVPLSYGNDAYRKEVIDLGHYYFGDNFTPIVDFLPLQEYLEKISSCGVVIMNHYRQQAVGNIMNALFRGSHVYLNDTPVRKAYRRLGFNVSGIDENLNLNNIQALTPLGAEEQKKNRDLANTHFSNKSLQAKTRSLLAKFG